MFAILRGGFNPVRFVRRPLGESGMPAYWLRRWLSMLMYRHGWSRRGKLSTDNNQIIADTKRVLAIDRSMILPNLTKALVVAANVAQIVPFSGFLSFFVRHARNTFAEHLGSFGASDHHTIR